MTNLIQFRPSSKMRRALKSAGRNMIPRLSEHAMAKLICEREMIWQGYLAGPKIKTKRSKPK